MSHNKQITCGIIGGVLIGGLFVAEVIPPVFLGVNCIEIARFCGEFFLALLKLVVLPLVFFSIFCGVASLGDVTGVGRLGKRTIVYYLATSFIAAFIGLVLVNLIQPGVGFQYDKEIPEDINNLPHNMTLGKLLHKQILSFFVNPIEAIAKGQSPIIPVMIASLLLAVGLLKTTHPKKQMLVDFMSIFNDVFMQITQMIIRLAPIGVFGLLVTVLFDHQYNLRELFHAISLFMITSLIALAIHGLIILPWIVYFFSSKTLKQFFSGIAPAMQVAFATDSSIATMPVTLNCMRENFGVSRRHSEFIIPIGTNVNMDATALYQGICAVFITQALGIDLSAVQQVIVFFAAVIASVGAAGLPSAGFVSLVIVINAIGIEYERALPIIGIIYAIDRVLDMCRTMVNVEGDCVGCIIIDEMEKLDQKQEDSNG